MADPDLSSASLHPATQQRVKAVRLGISLDWWAVLAAVGLAILVRFDVLHTVGW